jgi:lipopolysaccharide/colanic/teichoic acid biosynthesis glycosyltransferase
MFFLFGDRDERMPTKYQTQVKMTPKVKPSQVRSEAAANTASLHGPAVPKRASVELIRPMHAGARPAQDSRSESAPGAASRARLGYEVSKRGFDIVGGIILLIVAIPIILVAAAIIRLETEGSPFFIQTRLGKNGRLFKIFKLRGMFIDAKTRFASYYDYSAHRDLEFCFHHEDDPRVTRAGKLIRKTSIDELPNLWNVVLGDMSLVGPRPEIPEVLRLYGSYRDEYLSVKPGITCLSKCTGRDRLTKRETIEFDLSYIRKRSFNYDLSILWRTFKGVVLRRDVF